MDRPRPTTERERRAEEEMRAARRDGQKEEGAKRAGEAAKKDPRATGAQGTTRGTGDYRAKHAQDTWARKTPRYRAARAEMRAARREADQKWAEKEADQK